MFDENKGEEKMLEALIIMSFYYAHKFIPLKGKKYIQLSSKQCFMVQKHYDRYSKSKKGNKSPRTIDEYLNDLHRQGRIFLKTGIILMVIYVPLLLLLLKYGVV